MERGRVRVAVGLILALISASAISASALAQAPAAPTPAAPAAPPAAPKPAGPEMVPLEVFEAVKRAEAGADLELPLRDGGTFRLSEQRGKPVVLSFWASWCTPCRKELPALSAFAAANPGVAVFAINVDRAQADAEKFLAQVPFRLPVAFDTAGKALGRYGVTSMPTMFLIDKGGQVALRKVGFSEEKGLVELEAALKALK